MDDTHKTDDPGVEAYRRYLSGDGDALEEFIGIYRQGLTLFIRGIVFDPHDAEELMMDTFARLVVKKKQFEGHASIKTYLYAIGRNLALNHRRKYRKERYLSLDDRLAAVDDLEQDYLREEAKQRLYTAMQQLKTEYRETLYLLYFEEMSYAEAGKVLRKTIKQVSDLAYRGKIALRARLQNEVEDHDG